MQNADPGLAAVGVERRVLIWFVLYGIAVVGFIFFVVGDAMFALGLIAFTEFILVSLRPQPAFGASTFKPPAPDRWQSPIAALRWAFLFDNAWGIVSGAVVLTITGLVFLVVLAVMAWNHKLGFGNLVVFLLFVAWLSTRRLWIDELRRAVKVGAAKRLAPLMATVYVGTQGVTIDLRPLLTRPTPQRPYRFTVDYAELDEVRLMDGLTAQGFMASVAQYDPTFMPRMEFELSRFTFFQKTRPSLFANGGVGAQLLMRSATLFYMIGNADQFGPAVVAAWQTWRATHPAPAAPLATDSASVVPAN